MHKHKLNKTDSENISQQKHVIHPLSRFQSPEFTVLIR